MQPASFSDPYAEQLRQACWYSEADFKRHYQADLSQTALAWLYDPASLTAKVRALDPAAFRLQLLQQTMAYPSAWEQACLKLGPNKQVVTRAVHLCLDDTAWTYGRSVFAPTMRDGELNELTQLGAQALGDNLFKRHDLWHSPFEFARLTDNPRPLWARRCYFTCANQTILVAEVFLQL